MRVIESMSFPVRRCKCGHEHECPLLDARENGRRRWADGGGAPKNSRAAKGAVEGLGVEGAPESGKSAKKAVLATVARRKGVSSENTPRKCILHGTAACKRTMQCSLETGV